MVKKLFTIVFVLICFIGVVRAETVLTVEKVRSMALEYNRQFQAAKEELDRSRGNVISARSGALPQVSIDGRYTRNLELPSMFLPGQFFDKPGFVKIPAGQNNNFNLSLSLTQPLYVGGKVGTALDIARIYEKYSKEKVKEVESQIVFGAESMFYEAILTESSLDVLRSAFDQLNYNLGVVEKYFSQGMVSEYELLRAKVEKLNLEPQIIAAESQLDLSRKRLKSFLGLPLDDSIRLVSDFSDTAIINMPSFDSLTIFALMNRPEAKEAELQKNGYKKAIRIVKGNWLYPNLYANTSYDITASSDNFKLNDKNVSRSWSASLLLNIPIFDGGRTIGEIRKAKVDYHQAILTEQQTKDDIRLEVQQAYDNLMRSKKALDIQKETIAQAEEGMRIANLRYQSGIGTQLEILSAQTALTDAKTNFAGAIYSFRLAKSALRKATSYEIN